MVMHPAVTRTPNGTLGSIPRTSTKKGKVMLVKELKRKLEIVPDDLEVVVPGSDHSYDVVDYGTVVPAEFWERGNTYYE